MAQFVDRRSLMLFWLLAWCCIPLVTAHWCEDWSREIVVCQRCEVLSGTLSIENHIFSFLNDALNGTNGALVTWNPVNAPDPYLTEDVLYLLFDAATTQPCPLFIERFDFKFCPGEENPTCVDSNHVWAYQTAELLFIASGTLDDWRSMTIWNASTKEWLETLLLTEFATSSLCTSVPRIHPFLGAPTETPISCPGPEPGVITSPEAQPPHFGPEPNIPSTAPQSPLSPSAPPYSSPSSTPGSNCDNSSPQLPPTETPSTKSHENPAPARTGLRKTGLILGLVIGFSALAMIIAGLIVYFRRGDRAQLAPGPPQPHLFQNNPLYVRNTVEHINPLYRAQ